MHLHSHGKKERQRRNQEVKEPVQGGEEMKEGSLCTVMVIGTRPGSADPQETSLGG
jgi:hypothetical protein